MRGCEHEVADCGTLLRILHACGVPGHDRKGHEVSMDLLQVNGGGLDFSFERRFGFAASFDYRSS